MKQIFKIVFYVPNYEIKEKVFNYLNSHEISFKYESCGLNIGGYTFHVLNITETTKINFFTLSISNVLFIASSLFSAITKIVFSRQYLSTGIYRTTYSFII